MNLTAPFGAPSNRRPHQLGRVHGVGKGGAPVSAKVEWLFDSGADVSVVQDQVGALFTTVATGATASPTSGGAGILMVTGIDIEVQVETFGGHSHPARAQGDVGVKSSNDGSNLVGVAQLEAVSVTLVWSSRYQVGALVEDNLVHPNGHYVWWADPNIVKDADSLLERIRASFVGDAEIADDPEAALRRIRARYEYEVKHLLSGFVGYREARAVMTVTIDAWNGHLAPVRRVTEDQRRAHADEVEAITAHLLADCAAIENVEIRAEVERWLRFHTSEISTHDR